MSKIKDRRANNPAPSENRASIVVNSPKKEEKKKKIPYLKIAFGIFLAVAVIALVVFIINAVVTSHASRFEDVDFEDAEKNVDSIGNMQYFNYDVLLGIKDYKTYYDMVLENFAKSSSDIKSEEGVYTYAIYGIDSLASDAEGGEADMIMLVSINTNTKKTTYFTFEKNMFVYIPSVGVGPLNDAYEWGGANLLTKTLVHNYGININGYFELNLGVVVDMVEELGGVTFEADDAFVALVNASIDAFNDAPVSEGLEDVAHVEANNSKVKLNGNQVIAYIRGTGADRTAATANVVKAIVSSMAKGGNALDCIKVIGKNTESVVNKADFIALFKVGASIFKNGNETVFVGKNTINSDFVGSWVTCVTCDYDAERAALLTAIFGE